MEKEELIKFLKENLQVEVSFDDDRCINVMLKLCGEPIAYDWTYIRNDSAI
jgi:hypothetical protein